MQTYSIPAFQFLHADSAVPETTTFETISHAFVPPPTFIMTDFSQHKSSGKPWFSPPFYSYVGGYKMCHRVDANGWKHSSTDANSLRYLSMAVYLMQGEYDDDLLWPFRGDITLRLLNYRADMGPMMWR